ncbi:hypothetical protein C8R47DRAFT_749501 [Mycena vitilis]|nr:hypothetical protein C8R47DRAFT_749501 [Mycena vitilis]
MRAEERRARVFDNSRAGNDDLRGRFVGGGVEEWLKLEHDSHELEELKKEGGERKKDPGARGPACASAACARAGFPWVRHRKEHPIVESPLVSGSSPRLSFPHFQAAVTPTRHHSSFRRSRLSTLGCQAERVVCGRRWKEGQEEGRRWEGGTAGGRSEKEKEWGEARGILPASLTACLSPPSPHLRLRLPNDDATLSHRCGITQAPLPRRTPSRIHYLREIDAPTSHYRRFSFRYHYHRSRSWSTHASRAP